LCCLYWSHLFEKPIPTSPVSMSSEGSHKLGPGSPGRRFTAAHPGDGYLLKIAVWSRCLSAASAPPSPVFLKAGVELRESARRGRYFSSGTARNPASRRSGGELVLWERTNEARHSIGPHTPSHRLSMAPRRWGRGNRPSRFPDTGRPRDDAGRPQHIPGRERASVGTTTLDGPLASISPGIAGRAAFPMFRVKWGSSLGGKAQARGNGRQPGLNAAGDGDLRKASR